MKGTQDVMKIGRRVVELVRQKCMLKYGSGTLTETEQRQTTQYEDYKRCFEARQLIGKYRYYVQENRKQGRQIPPIEQIKILKEIQSGNCYQTSQLTFIIMSQIVPTGILVQLRDYSSDFNNPNGLRQDHLCVSIKPLHSSNDNKAIIIDPWPSCQLKNAQVVYSQDYFYNHMKYQIFKSYKKSQNKKKIYKTFEQFKQSDFNLKELQKIQKQISNKNDLLLNPLWLAIKYAPVKYQIPHIRNLDDIIADEQMFKLFKKGRLTVKQVAKKSIIYL